VFYVFLLIVGILCLAAYVLFIFNTVPGAKEERLGIVEPLPADTGAWRADLESEAGKQARAEGLVREERHYFYENAQRLVLQVRYRNPETREVVRVEPEVAVKRKRIKV
jgi:hypothetical protein